MQTPDQRSRTLLLASHNAGKLRELRALLEPLAKGWSLVGPAEAGVGDLQVEETGSSYAENAGLKAHAFADASGLPALADDSGLEVDALGGSPGIHSARYATSRYAGTSATGGNSDDGDNRRELLVALAGMPAAERTARYRAVVAVARPHQGEAWFAEGSCAGRIAVDERGSGGFGYDSVFELADGRRMAELSMDKKNEFSHRAQAVRAVAPLLERLARLLEGEGA